MSFSKRPQQPFRIDQNDVVAAKNSRQLAMTMAIAQQLHHECNCLAVCIHEYIHPPYCDIGAMFQN